MFKKVCGGFIGVPERMKAMQITKRHLIKLDNLKEAIKQLACNINYDSNSCYAYVSRIVEDRVGPLEDSAGNIISRGFLMAKYLSGYFSPVFTRYYIRC